jgi:hypothetical protein
MRGCYALAVSRFATMAILLAGLLLGAGCAWESGSSNNNASRSTFGPNIDETTGKEITHPL